MEHIKKRLVFYFYGFPGYKENRAIQIHLKCLKRYAHRFDEALFIISVDDISNKELIADVEHSLIDCGFNDIHFKVHKNNFYCEAQPFYEEVIMKLGELDGLTFIGHTKGITNYEKAENVPESIDTWLLGMYYMNLEFIEEVEYSMCYDVNAFFGTYLMNTNDLHLNKNELCYNGTFYWINCMKIINMLNLGTIEALPKLFNRSYMEAFPGEILPWKQGDNLGSIGRKFLYKYNPYCETRQILEFLLDKSTEEYDKFKEEILSDIK